MQWILGQSCDRLRLNRSVTLIQLEFSRLGDKSFIKVSRKCSIKFIKLKIQISLYSLTTKLISHKISTERINFPVQYLFIWLHFLVKPEKINSSSYSDSKFSTNRTYHLSSKKESIIYIEGLVSKLFLNYSVSPVPSTFHEYLAETKVISTIDFFDLISTFLPSSNKPSYPTLKALISKASRNKNKNKNPS